jgi:hypothetical protein
MAGKPMSTMSLRKKKAATGPFGLKSGCFRRLRLDLQHKRHIVAVVKRIARKELLNKLRRLGCPFPIRFALGSDGHRFVQGENSLTFRIFDELIIKHHFVQT